MIVLDEQLMGRDLETVIGAWYRGRVAFITALRPGTVIKDDAIPTVLRSQNQPTFVTINESDFWTRVRVTKDFCVVCCALSDAQVMLLPGLLRTVLRHPRFRSKAVRMGCVIRVSTNGMWFYTADDANVKAV